MSRSFDDEARIPVRLDLSGLQGDATALENILAGLERRAQRVDRGVRSGGGVRDNGVAAEKRRLAEIERETKRAADSEARAVKGALDSENRQRREATRIAQQLYREQEREAKRVAAEQARAAKAAADVEIRAAREVAREHQQFRADLVRRAREGEQAAERSAKAQAAGARSVGSVFKQVFAANILVDFFRDGLAAARDFFRESIGAAQELANAQRFLASASYLTGTALEQNAAIAERLRTEFGLTRADAQALVATSLNFTAAAGQIEKTEQFVRALGDAAIASGRPVSELKEILNQLQAGSDEATEKLFGGKQPSQIYAEYAATLGTTAAKLDAVQKKQALLNEVIKRGELVAGAGADKLKTTAGALEQLDSLLTDLRASVGQAILDNQVFADAVIYLNRALQNGTVESAQLRETLKTFAPILQGIGIAIVLVLSAVAHAYIIVKGTVESIIYLFGQLFVLFTQGIQAADDYRTITLGYLAENTRSFDRISELRDKVGGAILGFGANAEAAGKQAGTNYAKGFQSGLEARQFLEKNQTAAAAINAGFGGHYDPSFVQQVKLAQSIGQQGQAGGGAGDAEAKAKRAAEEIRRAVAAATAEVLQLTRATEDLRAQTNTLADIDALRWTAAFQKYDIAVRLAAAAQERFNVAGANTPKAELAELWKNIDRTAASAKEARRQLVDLAREFADKKPKGPSAELDDRLAAIDREAERARVDAGVQYAKAGEAEIAKVRAAINAKADQDRLAAVQEYVSAVIKGEQDIAAVRKRLSLDVEEALLAGNEGELARLRIARERAEFNAKVDAHYGKEKEDLAEVVKLNFQILQIAKFILEVKQSTLDALAEIDALEHGPAGTLPSGVQGPSFNPGDVNVPIPEPPPAPEITRSFGEIISAALAATNAVEAFGAGFSQAFANAVLDGQNFARAMAALMLKVIGELCIAWGQYHLALGIANSLNPLTPGSGAGQIAGGLALLALGGLLIGASSALSAGGASGAASAGAGAGNSGTSSAGATSDEDRRRADRRAFGTSGERRERRPLSFFGGGVDAPVVIESHIVIETDEGAIVKRVVQKASRGTVRQKLRRAIAK